MHWIKRFVKWIDRDIDRHLLGGPKPASFAIVFVPALLGLIAEPLGASRKATTAGVLASMAIIMAFWFWRAFLSIHRRSRESDRLYDRKTKYSLPPEYADTHSATRAAELRAKAKQRK